MITVQHASLVDEVQIRTAQLLARDDPDCCIDLYDSTTDLFLHADRPVLCELRHPGGTPHFAFCIPRGTQHARREIAAERPGAYHWVVVESLLTPLVAVELAHQTAHLSTASRLAAIQEEVHRRLRRAVDRDPRLGQRLRLGGYCGKRVTRELVLSRAIRDAQSPSGAPTPSGSKLIGRHQALFRAIATGGQLGVGAMAEQLGLDTKRYTNPRTVVNRAARAGGIGTPYSSPRGQHLLFEFGDADPIAAEIRAGDYLSTRCRHLPDRSQCPICLAKHGERRRKRLGRPIAVRLDPIRL